MMIVEFQHRLSGHKCRTHATPKKNRQAGQLSARLRALFATGLGLASAWACTALYPEIETPLKPVPAGRELDPPPPANVLYIAAREAEIARKTRDGRSWGEEGPNAYVIVFSGDQELFRTGVSRSYTPSWPNAPKRNYELTKDATLRIEMWDESAIHKMPICLKELKNLSDHAASGNARIVCEGGTTVNLDIQPANAKFGLGFSYKIQDDGVLITKVLPLSPASRAGLREELRIVRIMGQPVQGKTEDAIKSTINSNAAIGLQLAVQPEGGPETLVELKEGPIYLKAQ